MEKIEYRVRPVTRYIVTRYHETADGKVGGSVGKGEYDTAHMAYEVGYALCKHEHEALGYPPADMRIIYPERVFETPTSQWSSWPQDAPQCRSLTVGDTTSLQGISDKVG